MIDQVKEDLRRARELQQQIEALHAETYGLITSCRDSGNIEGTVKAIAAKEVIDQISRLHFMSHGFFTVDITKSNWADRLLSIYEHGFHPGCSSAAEHVAEKRYIEVILPELVQALGYFLGRGEALCAEAKAQLP